MSEQKREMDHDIFIALPYPISMGTGSSKKNLG